MTDIEMLPLPEKVVLDRHSTTGVRIHGYDASSMEAYARAVAEHNVKRITAEAQSVAYNRKRIAWELERTAMGDGFYGNALRVAKDLPEATPKVKSLLDRWATGAQEGLSDRTDLCALALKIYAAQENSDD